MHNPNQPADEPENEGELPSDRAKRVGGLLGDFAAIRVEYGPQEDLIAAMDEIRAQGLAVRAQRLATGRRLAMPAMRTIAQMGVGKTWGAERLQEMRNPTDPEDQRRPVVVATVNTSGDPASIPSAILEALGRRAPGHGKPPVLWRRANDALEEHEVELVVFDEMNRAARRPTMSPVIGGDLMDFLAKGRCAVVFLGTEETNKLFDRAKPLRDRLKAPVVMRALDWEIDQDRLDFIAFLSAMDDAMKAEGLVDRKAGFDAPKAEATLAKPLWEVSLGRLRPLCLVLEEAIGILHRAGGRRVITSQVLSDAVESMLKANEIAKYNPFLGEKPE